MTLLKRTKNGINSVDKIQNIFIGYVVRSHKTKYLPSSTSTDLLIEVLCYVVINTLLPTLPVSFSVIFLVVFRLILYTVYGS